MDGGSRDPTAVRSVSVTADDVVAAVEARRQGDQPVVLRITPPFSGRMRARLHVPGTADPDALHVDPDRFLRATAPDYTVSRHHDRHAAAIEAWRETVRDHFAECIEIETPDGPHRIDVAVLG